jgi:glyoxylase-like metal-dependent hydrolase (beta-lactamase superfamily II)
MSTSSSAAWTVLFESVHVRQSRAFWMNSTVLLDSEHTLLVDPGVLPSELDEIARLVNQAEPERITLILTHGHWDHVLGAPWWPKARVVAHDRCSGAIAADLAHIREEADGIAREHGEAWPQPFAAPPIHDASSGQRFLKLDPWRLVLRDAFGHSDSQLSVHVPELSLLIAADMLSDIEIPILNTAPAVYRGTLETLRPLAEGGAFEALVPGHGAIALGPDEILGRVRADLGYLTELERGAVEAKRSGADLEATQQKLAAMDYAGKDDATYPMNETHRKNVKFAWEAARARA